MSVFRAQDTPLLGSYFADLVDRYNDSGGMTGNGHREPKPAALQATGNGGAEEAVTCLME